MNKLFGLLLIVFLFSALGLVTVHNQTRAYFTQLKNEEIRYEDLMAEYNILQLQRAQNIKVSHIQKQARKHGLHTPEIQNVKIIGN